MQKGLSFRISLRVKDKTSSRNARNLAAFLAQREEIQQALNDGWPVYQIWETLHAEQKIAASYNTFCNQVKRLVLKNAGRSHKQAMSLPASPAKALATGHPAAASRPDGFTFSSTPNDEDIL